MHVIRNAGGRVTEDVVRSLSISAALLGTRGCIVIHHSNCGLLGQSDEELRTRVAEASGARAPFGFLGFEDLEQSVRDDVAALRAIPYFPPRLRDPRLHVRRADGHAGVGGVVGYRRAGSA